MSFISVLERYDDFNFEDFFSSISIEDVKRSLKKEFLDEKDLLILISPKAKEMIEEIAKRAKKEHLKHFGNTVLIYTPLYISNYCVNQCAYCGFNHTNKIQRAKLTVDEILSESEKIASEGIKDILLLTGESKEHTSLEYLKEAVSILNEKFESIGIEIYPMDEVEYEELSNLGVDFVSVYQETYNKKRYDEVHLKGPKKNFEYRLNTPERALKAGVRGVSIGALLGLDDFRKDAFFGALHGKYLIDKFPSAEVSFSFPRLRPHAGSFKPSTILEEVDLAQIMMAFRIFMPFAGMNLSTREGMKFRNGMLGLAPTKMSAGVLTSVGGHGNEQKGDEQFVINDDRSIEGMIQDLKARGYQGILKDYVNLTKY